MVLAIGTTACRTLLDPTLADNELLDTVFTRTPHKVLEQALACIDALVRPPDDVYYRELDARYRTLRLFLPTLLRQFSSVPARQANLFPLVLIGLGYTNFESNPNHQHHRM